MTDNNVVNIYAVKRRAGTSDPAGVFFYNGDWASRADNDLIETEGWTIPSMSRYDGWKILEIDGIGPCEIEIFSEEKGSGDGVIITGKRQMERHIDITTRQVAGVNSRMRADAIAFHDPDCVYDVCITYMDRTLWVKDCELEGVSIPATNVAANQELTVSFICADSFYTPAGALKLVGPGIDPMKWIYIDPDQGEYETSELHASVYIVTPEAGDIESVTFSTGSSLYFRHESDNVYTLARNFGMGNLIPVSIYFNGKVIDKVQIDDPPSAADDFSVPGGKIEVYILEKYQGDTIWGVDVYNGNDEVIGQWAPAFSAADGDKPANPEGESGLYIAGWYSTIETSSNEYIDIDWIVWNEFQDEIENSRGYAQPADMEIDIDLDMSGLTTIGKVLPFIFVVSTEDNGGVIDDKFFMIRVPDIPVVGTSLIGGDKITVYGDGSATATLTALGGKVCNAEFYPPDTADALSALKGNKTTKITAYVDSNAFIEEGHTSTCDVYLGGSRIRGI